MIVFFEIEPAEKTYLSKFFRKGAAVYVKEKLSAENAEDFSDATVISTFVGSNIDKKILQKMPRLKLIVTRSTGYDHISMDECKKRGIAVANVPSYGEYTVAEHTFGLILTLSRNIHKAYYRMKSSEHFSYKGLEGFDLRGKTLGVIGAGHIGLHVIKIGRGFGMNVLVTDKNRSSLLAEVLNFQYVELEELLKNSDVISLHLPYMPQTHHLINRSNLALIKKGAILVNTARGGIVETEAIIEGLDRGIFSGVGLDVLEGEQMIREEKEVLTREHSPDDLKLLLSNHILMNRENVIITPHNAFNSREAVQRILETTKGNIEAFLAGKTLNLIV
ncbi:hydroxyacid dehydrogenase [bacterium]|nr:hydroxyacid dehydrogenase [bacterium]